MLFLISNMAISKLADTTKVEPTIIFKPKGSLNTITPIIMLVIGSKVLSIDVRSLPIRKALFWKSETAPVVTSKEKITQRPQPEIVEGKMRLLVKIQMKNEDTELIKTTQKQSRNPETPRFLNAERSTT